MPRSNNSTSLGNFLEQRIESLIEQLEPRDVRIAQIDNDAGTLGRFDAGLAHGILQRSSVFPPLPISTSLRPHMAPI